MPLYLYQKIENGCTYFFPNYAVTSHHFEYCMNNLITYLHHNIIKSGKVNTAACWSQRVLLEHYLEPGSEALCWSQRVLLEYYLEPGSEALCNQ